MTIQQNNDQDEVFNSHLFYSADVLYIMNE